MTISPDRPSTAADSRRVHTNDLVKLDRSRRASALGRLGLAFALLLARLPGPGEFGAQEVASGDFTERHADRRDLAREVLEVGLRLARLLAVGLQVDAVAVVLAVLREQD